MSGCVPPLLLQCSCCVMMMMIIRKIMESKMWNGIE